MRIVQDLIEPNDSPRLCRNNSSGSEVTFSALVEDPDPDLIQFAFYVNEPDPKLAAKSPAGGLIPHAGRARRNDPASWKVLIPAQGSPLASAGTYVVELVVSDNAFDVRTASPPPTSSPDGGANQQYFDRYFWFVTIEQGSCL